MSTLVHLVDAVLSVAQTVVAQPDPSPTPQPTTLLNTDGITSFITTKILPILLAILGVVFISRAGKGEMSKVLTSSAIAMIGIVFIVGAGLLLFFGQGLVNLIFGVN